MPYLPPMMRAEDHQPLGTPERLKPVPAAPKPPCKHQWLAMPDSKTHSRCADCGTVTLTEMVASKPPPAPVPSAQCQEEDDDALGVCIKPVTISFDLASSSGVMSLFTTPPTSDFERLMREATVQAVDLISGASVTTCTGLIKPQGRPLLDFERLMIEANIKAMQLRANPPVFLDGDFGGADSAAQYASLVLDPAAKLVFNPNTYTTEPAPKPFPETTPYTFTIPGYLNPKHGRAPADTRVDLYFMDGSTTEDFNSNFVNWSPDLGPRTVIGWRRTTVWQKHDGSGMRPAGVGYCEQVQVKTDYGAEQALYAGHGAWGSVTEWRRLTP